MSRRNPPKTPETALPADAAQIEDDAALFRSAVGPVRAQAEMPLPPERQKPKPRARQFHRDEAAALRQSRESPFAIADLDIGELLEFRRPNVGPAILRRLKRGQYAIEDEIDLHGSTAAEAGVLLRQFLHEARDGDHRCVRIVHGKGLRSADGVPVLKGVTEQLLRHHDAVLAFASQRDAAGGSGSLLVLLRHR